MNHQPNFDSVIDEDNDLPEPDNYDQCAAYDRRWSYPGDLLEDCESVANPSAILSGSELMAETFKGFDKIFGRQDPNDMGDGKQDKRNRNADSLGGYYSGGHFK